MSGERLRSYRLGQNVADIAAARDLPNLDVLPLDAILNPKEPRLDVPLLAESSSLRERLGRCRVALDHDLELHAEIAHVDLEPQSL